VRLDERSRKAATLAVYNGKAYIGWVGESNGDLYVMSTEDGVDWRSKVKTDDQTLKSFKLTGGHKLTAVFQGKDSDNIYCLMSRDGVDF
jgi:hypothetical protein